MPTDTFKKLKPEKRLRIIRSATENFAANGFSKTSMEAVAAGAGIAKGALYRYFDGKKDLFMLVVNTLVAELHLYAQRFLDEHRDCDTYETLRDHLISIYMLREKFHVHMSVLCNMLYQEHLEFKGEVLAKFGKLGMHYTRMVLQRGIARGEVSEDIDLDAAAFMVDSVIDRFHDGVLMEFLDHGFGLYHQPQEVINRKADQIILAFQNAFGKKSSCSSASHVA